MKSSHKWLKIILALRFKKFGLAFIALKLDEFLFFDNFFLDLADFWNLNNFLPFKFSNFLAISSSSPISNLLTSPLPTPSYLTVYFSYDIIVFGMEVNRAAFLGKP